MTHFKTPKFKYLIFLLFTLVKNSDAQESLLKEVEFKPVKFSVKDRFFNISRIIDARIAKNMYGQVFIDYKKNTLVNYSNLGEVLSNEFNKQFPHQSNLTNIVIKINSLKIYQLDYTSQKKCNSHVEVFSEKNDKFLKIGEYNIISYGDYMFLPFILLEDIIKLLSKKDIEISTIEERKEISEDELIDGKYKLGEDLEVSGVFRFFSDYKTDTPSKYYSYLIDEDFLPNSPILFSLGKYKKNKIIYKKTEIEADFWGYRKGKQLYFRVFKNVFVPIYNYQGILIFDATQINFAYQEVFYQSKTPLIITNDPIVAVGTLMTKQLIENIDKNNVKLYKIDMKTGYYYPYKLSNN